MKHPYNENSGLTLVGFLTAMCVIFFLLFVSACTSISESNCKEVEIEPIRIPLITEELKYGVYPSGEKFASTQDVPAQPGRMRDLAVHEFLLRRVMAQYRDRTDWYIDLDRLGVPDTFPERFSDIPLNIYPKSSGYSDYSGRIFNSKTRKNGVQAISVISRWIDDYTAEVEYGHYMHSEAAIFHIGKLKLQGDTWIFELEGGRVF